MGFAALAVAACPTDPDPDPDPRPCADADADADAVEAAGATCLTVCRDAEGVDAGDEASPDVAAARCRRAFIDVAVAVAVVVAVAVAVADSCWRWAGGIFSSPVVSPPAPTDLGRSPVRLLWLVVAAVGWPVAV